MQRITVPSLDPAGIEVLPFSLDSLAVINRRIIPKLYAGRGKSADVLSKTL
jgi:hypothetical protein